MAQPKVWLQTDGETTTVHTPFTTRAKDNVGCFKRRLTWISERVERGIDNALVQSWHLFILFAILCHPLQSFGIVYILLYILVYFGIIWYLLIACDCVNHLLESPLISLASSSIAKELMDLYSGLRLPLLTVDERGTPRKILQAFSILSCQRGTNVAQVSKRFQKAIRVITVTSDCDSHVIHWQQTR